MLGASILLEAVLGRRLKEIEALLADGGRGLEKAISAASAAPTCPACGVETESVSTAIERLVDRLSDEQWSAAIASAELCLPDLLSIWSVARRRKQSLEAWRPIARQHVARLDALRQQLEAFAHNSSHDRRHRIDEAQQESAAVATRVIAGAAAAQPSNRKSTRG